MKLKEELIRQFAPELLFIYLSNILNDKDILLARLAREAFSEYYDSKDATQFHIPKQLLADKEVVIAAVGRCPVVLMQDVLLNYKLLADSEVFRTYLNSKRLKDACGDAATRVQNLVSKFSAEV